MPTVRFYDPDPVIQTFVQQIGARQFAGNSAESHQYLLIYDDFCGNQGIIRVLFKLRCLRDFRSFGHGEERGAERDKNM